MVVSGWIWAADKAAPRRRPVGMVWKGAGQRSGPPRSDSHRGGAVGQFAGAGVVLGREGVPLLLELGLAPDLAVIASCASAATRPDGMWTSITSALLAGGTQTIVGALGSIPDGASAEIVTDFHRHRSELGPARALAEAQRAAIARGVPVGVWSSFAVFGHDPRTTRRN